MPIWRNIWIVLPHSDLLKSVARRIIDRHVLWLIKLWLKAPAEEWDAVIPPVRFDERRLETEPRRELRYRHRRKPSMTVHLAAHGHRASRRTLLTKYRYKVLEGALRERIRTIIRQVCKELGVQIVSGVLSREHVHMFVEIPPHIAVSDFVRRVKGRSSHRVQMEFPDLRKRYWGRHFWARGYFSTTSGNITDDVILQYLQEHEPTGVSR